MQVSCLVGVTKTVFPNGRVVQSGVTMTVFPAGRVVQSGVTMTVFPAVRVVQSVIRSRYKSLYFRHNAIVHDYIQCLIKY